MASISGQSEDLFVLVSCWKDSDDGQKFFLNFWSDPHRDTSIQLPQYMIDAARLPEGVSNPIREIAEMQAQKKKVQAAIRSSLKARHGNKMPPIYLTEDDKHFVMNLYIYKKHCEDFKKLSQSGTSPVFLEFSKMTLAVVQENVAKVSDEPRGVFDGHKFITGGEIYWNSSGCEPTGRRAKMADISPFLLESATDRRRRTGREEPLTPSAFIHAHRHIMCIGLEDRNQSRSIFFNIIATDQAHSIRLPNLMIEMWQEANKRSYMMADMMPLQQTQRLVGGHLRECFDRLYAHEQPVVYVSKKSDKDLVINVPFLMEQILQLRLCMGRYENRVRDAFFEAITDYHKRYFLARSGRNDVQSNDNMTGIVREDNYVQPGRLARIEEIHSLLLI